MNHPILSSEWGISESAPFIDYMGAVIKNSTTPNGVCGFKLQWDQIERLRAMLAADIPADQKGKVLDRLFPGVVYINLLRRNTRQAAISYYRALYTNDWWSKADVLNTQVVSPDPPYDSEKIRYWETRLTEFQNSWSSFFAKRNIIPLCVEYENLEKDWCSEAERCLGLLQLDTDALDKGFQSTFTRQADARTRAWERRLNEETK